MVMVLCCPSRSQPNISFCVDHRPSSCSFLMEIGWSNLLPVWAGGGKMSLIAWRMDLVAWVMVSVDVVWSIMMKSSTYDSNSGISVGDSFFGGRFKVCRMDGGGDGFSSGDMGSSRVSRMCSSGCGGSVGSL